MTAKRTLTLRLNDDDLIGKLDDLMRLFDVGTSSAAINLAIRNYNEVREQLHQEQRRRRELEERVERIRTAWDQHQAYKSNLADVMREQDD